MTIKELYEWAIQHKVENCDVLVYNCHGDMTYLSETYIEPRDGYTEIELL